MIPHQRDPPLHLPHSGQGTQFAQGIFADAESWVRLNPQGVSNDVVKTRFLRARTMLRQSLAERGEVN